METHFFKKKNKRNWKYQEEKGRRKNLNHLKKVSCSGTQLFLLLLCLCFLLLFDGVHVLVRFTFFWLVQALFDKPDTVFVIGPEPSRPLPFKSSEGDIFLSLSLEPTRFLSPSSLITDLLVHNLKLRHFQWEHEKDSECTQHALPLVKFSYIYTYICVYICICMYTYHIVFLPNRSISRHA